MIPTYLADAKEVFDALSPAELADVQKELESELRAIWNELGPEDSLLLEIRQALEAAGLDPSKFP